MENKSHVPRESHYGSRETLNIRMPSSSRCIVYMRTTSELSYTSVLTTTRRKPTTAWWLRERNSPLVLRSQPETERMQSSHRCPQSVCYRLDVTGELIFGWDKPRDLGGATNFIPLIVMTNLASSSSPIMLRWERLCSSLRKFLRKRCLVLQMIIRLCPEPWNSQWQYKRTRNRPTTWRGMLLRQAQTCESLIELTARTRMRVFEKSAKSWQILRNSISKCALRRKLRSCSLSKLNEGITPPMNLLDSGAITSRRYISCKYCKDFRMSFIESYLLIKLTIRHKQIFEALDSPNKSKSSRKELPHIVSPKLTSHGGDKAKGKSTIIKYKDIW